MPINSGVPQGSVVGRLVFLIYIIGLHKAIQLCKMHHFADDTNIFQTNKSVNLVVNCDMKHLNNWLSAIEFLLHFEKTKLVVFNLQGKPFLMKSKSNLVEKGYIKGLYNIWFAWHSKNIKRKWVSFTEEANLKFFIPVLMSKYKKLASSS